MAEINELQHLIDTDPEFASLISAAHIHTNSLFDDKAEDILATKSVIPAFKRIYDLKEFFAKYKVILGWSAMMGQVLQKIHGKDYKDSSAGIDIPGTTKIVNIYKAPGPWAVRIYIDKETTNPEVYIEECISIIDKATGKVLEDDNIEFRLAVPRVRYNMTNMLYGPKLKDSLMSITLKKEDSGKILDHTIMPVKDFTPGRLVEFIRRWYNI